MREKFSIVSLFIFFSLFIIHPQDSNRTITFVLNSSQKITNKNMIIVKYLIDIASISINQKDKNIIVKENNETFDADLSDKNINFIISNNLDAFYYILAEEKNEKVSIDIKVFAIDNSIIYSNSFTFSEKNLSDSEKILSDDDLNNWIAIFEDSIPKLYSAKEKLFKRKFIKTGINLERDFPFIGIGINAVSSKIFLDEKIIYYPNKIFSFFPMDFRVSFYPFKYFEVGFILNINYDNMVIKYIENVDDDNIKYDYFDVGFTMNYGFFCGPSFFVEDKFHYSFGAQITNLYYDLTRENAWQKTNDANSYFIPQLAFYQKLDLKLFKFIYLSIAISLKTLPMFYLDNNYFYSKPFHYDFFYPEFSLIGLSLIF